GSLRCRSLTTVAPARIQVGIVLLPSESLRQPPTTQPCQPQRSFVPIGPQTRSRRNTVTSMTQPPGRRRSSRTTTTTVLGTVVVLVLVAVVAFVGRSTTRLPGHSPSPGSSGSPSPP